MGIHRTKIAPHTPTSNSHISHGKKCPPPRKKKRTTTIETYLVKTSQQAHDPALNILLGQAGARSIAPHGVPAGDARDEGRDGGLLDEGGSGDDGGEGPGRGLPCGDGGGGSEDGGAEHLGRWVSIEGFGWKRRKDLDEPEGMELGVM